MLKISIVPDTNVFMSQLDKIKRLCEDEFPVDVSMSVSKVVLRELDYNKGRSAEAREAIRFLEKVYNMPVAELEGKLKDDRMDVIEDSAPVAQAENNDDRILNFASKQVNPVLLTADKAFYLKSKCYNVESVLVQDMSYEDLKFRILRIYTEIEPMDIDDAGLESDDEIRRHIRDRLLPVVLTIMERGIGKPYVQFFPDDVKLVTLDFLLGLISKETRLFNPYLPRRSKNVIQDLRMKIKNAHGEDLRDLGSQLLILFRVVY